MRKLKTPYRLLQSAGKRRAENSWTALICLVKIPRAPFSIYLVNGKT